MNNHWNYVTQKICLLIFYLLVWQHPNVNLFKHFNIGEWKKCSKEGEVSAIMVSQTLKNSDNI